MLTGDTHADQVPPTVAVPADVVRGKIHEPQHVVPAPSEITPITECIVVKPGDSEWKIIARRTENIVGKHPLPPPPMP